MEKRKSGRRQSAQSRQTIKMTREELEKVSLRLRSRSLVVREVPLLRLGVAPNTPRCVGHLRVRAHCSSVRRRNLQRLEGLPTCLNSDEVSIEKLGC